MSERTGEETRSQQTKDGEQPDRGTSIVLTLTWVAAVVVAFVLGVPAIGRGIGALALVLLVAGVFWRPLRSGDSPAIVYAVPLWGIVAQQDRVNTSQKLRTAKIYVEEDKTKTIPATTYRKHGDTYVRFNGGGHAGMSPDRITEMLERNARVWRCRSFAVAEDPARPGRMTIQLGKGDAVHTELDNAIIGTVS